MFRFNISSEFARTFNPIRQQTFECPMQRTLLAAVHAMKNDWYRFMLWYSVYDTNFCPLSIFLHQTWTVCFVKHLCHILHASQSESDLHLFFLHTKNTIKARCS